MDSTSLNPLPQPLTQQQVMDSFGAYRTALAGMDNEALMAHLVQINAAMQEQQQRQFGSQLQQSTDDYLSSLDHVTSRRWDPMESLQADRGSAHSLPSASRQQSPAERLSEARRIPARVAEQIIRNVRVAAQKSR